MGGGWHDVTGPSPFDISVVCDYTGQSRYYIHPPESEVAYPTTCDMYVINIVYEINQSVVRIPVLYRGEEVIVYETDDLKVRLKPAVCSEEDSRAVSN
jgi:hypothetical protein